MCAALSVLLTACFRKPQKCAFPPCDLKACLKEQVSDSES